MRYKIIWYVFILASLINPTISNGEDTYIDYKYFPMSTGSIYEYKVVGNKPFGMIIYKKGETESRNLNVREFKYLTKIEKKDSIEGKDYYKHVEIKKDVAGVDPSIYFRRLSKEGLYFMMRGAKEFIDTPFPVKNADKWEYFDTVKNLKVSCRLEVKNEIYVEDTTYQDAIVIERKWVRGDRNYISKEYYAANIGLVRRVFFEKLPGDSDLIAETTLLSYK